LARLIRSLDDEDGGGEFLNLKMIEYEKVMMMRMTSSEFLLQPPYLMKRWNEPISV
jgi:hypothetical protein